VTKTLLSIKVHSGGETSTLYSYIYQHLFVPWAGNLNGSLAFAAAYVLLWLALMALLYRKRILIKI
jgi:predicted acyltransferase